MTQIETINEASISPDQNRSFETDYLKADLKGRVVRGGIWVFALRITDRLFGLARTIVLARLLAPADFGLFGIALLAMSALETFSQTGFNAALIQKKGDTKPYLDTAWTIQAIRGIFLAMLLFAIASYVAAFFKVPASKPILQVIGLSVLLQGFTNIGVVYFQKELKFHKQFVYMLSGTVVDVGVTISAAILLRSVWALVFGLLAGNLVRMVMSYIIHSYRPRLRLEGTKAKELYSFGRWLLGSSVLIFLLTQGDDILVGYLLSTTALGLYQMAYRISQLPTTEITKVISQVTFPAFSKLQENPDKFRRAYLRTVQVVAVMAMPVGGGLFALAPEFTKVVLGEKWIPMVVPLQILVLQGMSRALGASTGPAFEALGKPNIITKWNFINLLIFAIIIYPLIVSYGITGAALSIAILVVITWPFVYKQLLTLIGCSFRQFFRCLITPLIATSLMTAIVMLAKLFLTVNLINLGLLILVGAVSYCVVVYLLDRIYNFGLVVYMKKLLKEI